MANRLEKAKLISDLFCERSTTTLKNVVKLIDIYIDEWHEIMDDAPIDELRKYQGMVQGFKKLRDDILSGTVSNRIDMQKK